MRSSANQSADPGSDWKGSWPRPPIIWSHKPWFPSTMMDVECSHRGPNAMNLLQRMRSLRRDVERCLPAGTARPEKKRHRMTRPRLGHKGQTSSILSHDDLQRGVNRSQLSCNTNKHPLLLPVLGILKHRSELSFQTGCAQTRLLRRLFAR